MGAKGLERRHGHGCRSAAAPEKCPCWQLHAARAGPESRAATNAAGSSLRAPACSAALAAAALQARLMRSGPWPKRGPAGAPPLPLRTMPRNSWWLHWNRRRQKSAGSPGAGCSGGMPKRRQQSDFHSASQRASGLQQGGAARPWARGRPCSRPQARPQHGPSTARPAAGSRHGARQPTVRRCMWLPDSAGPEPGPGRKQCAPPVPAAAPASRPQAEGRLQPADRPGCARSCAAKGRAGEGEGTVGCGRLHSSRRRLALQASHGSEDVAPVC